MFLIHHRSESQAERAASAWDMPVLAKWAKGSGRATQWLIKQLPGRSTHSFFSHIFIQSKSHH